MACYVKFILGKEVNSLFNRACRERGKGLCCKQCKKQVCRTRCSESYHKNCRYACENRDEACRIKMLLKLGMLDTTIYEE